MKLPSLNISIWNDTSLSVEKPYEVYIFSHVNTMESESEYT